MRYKMHFPMTVVRAIVGALAFTSLSSCDTPKTIAWSYYDCAKDTLEAGDPYAARDYLKACKKTVDKALTLKADSLMEVIEKAIEQNTSPQ